MIVVDAGTWFVALSDPGAPGGFARAELVRDDDWVVPPHAKMEVLRTIRKLESTGTRSADAIERLAREVIGTDVRVVPADDAVLRAVWSMRHSVSMYDAPYVAVARRLDVPLVTVDLRLARAARAGGIQVRVPGEVA